MVYPGRQTLSTIRREERQISKNAGLFCSRIVLLFFLFFLFFFLRPTAIYLFTAFAFFPTILAWLFSRNKPREQAVILESCAKKYFYTPSHYTGERYTSIFIFFALVFWQFMLLRQNLDPAIIQKAPAVCMFFYLVTRFIVTEIVKKQINRYYETLECLELE